ncbi:DUF3090 domain-containing protein [Sediminivirga luteola]|uniref:DUF3090 domain-containing protein n=1 Tax=Sediminivirga luteola TaxID=1774748 RepID=UPI001F5607E2|nr:DUF3090 domain-containing protein [Sediminivirga luteola]MCI2263916.1 DUF3090 domain-containing protein [Sediminivirga luteola]
MPATVFDHSEPDRFIVGTVGLPGERTFYLQAKSGRRVTSVIVEKEQASVLAERMDALLDLVLAKQPGGAGVPAEPLPELVDNAELSTPIEPEFRVGTMSLAWDTSADRLVLECFELSQADAEAGESLSPDDESGIDRDVLRVSLDGARAREFVRRAEQVVSAGRGDCPLCSLPLDAGGHLCPRANGIPR